MDLELSFGKRYILIYALVLATAHHIIVNINAIYDMEIFNNIWPIDIIILVITLMFISIFDRNQKSKISNGIFFKQTAFEKSAKFLKNENRIKNKEKLQISLKNIKNEDFYSKYYKFVKKNENVIVKNAEYCIARDIVFTVFIIMITMIILTFIWPSHFYKELIVSIISYIIGVFSYKRKAKDFVLQILVEKSYLERE